MNNFPPESEAKMSSIRGVSLGDRVDGLLVVTTDMNAAVLLDNRGSPVGELHWRDDSFVL